MSIRNMICAAGALGFSAAAFASATPEVGNVRMSQSGNSHLVTITYDLDSAAVVTLEVQTNYVENAETKWASIGGEALWNSTGDVWRKVEAGSCMIKWRPNKSWPGHVVAAGGARAVVTAWALDNTPDYMVVDIRPGAQPNSQRYYPAADYLPGGLLANEDYRRYSLVMRKIMAQGITWTMGSLRESSRTSPRENMHEVTLTNDYYIGVFQFTQAQWTCVDANPNHDRPRFKTDGAMRPVEQVSYNELRLMASAESSGSTTASDEVIRANSWPNPPASDSFLGLLNARTGLDFDLPSEAQWEYACRAGNGEGRWNDGSPILYDGTCPNFVRLGRMRRNGGWLHTGSGNYDSDYTEPSSSVGPTNGTAIVGSYAPSSWGLYDMHGNLWEWCLDWFSEDITALNGAVNISLADATLPVSGTASARVARGGSWYQPYNFRCRSAQRWNKSPASRDMEYGFRVVCRAGLD